MLWRSSDLAPPKVTEIKVLELALIDCGIQSVDFLADLLGASVVTTEEKLHILKAFVDLVLDEAREVLTFNVVHISLPSKDHLRWS